MIGFLTGRAAFRDDPYVYIDVQGVGYKVLATREVLTAASTPEKIFTIFTYTHVKEDALELFGFMSPEDLKLFEKFISISGIGPKTAIQIFSTGTRNEIIEAIISGNVTFFTAVPRLGKKNAQKIILELKSAFAKGGDELAMIEDANIHNDIITALQTMGFNYAEIQTALKTVPTDLSADQTLKLALKNLGRS
ncbi:MAG TPA: Holliday junction branch migration protein RuvA [Candidatus Levybacteria bacterium]|nr:Holliday junction branch migration protein RuvA [Candidatus Levybacteria bacterium]